MALYWQYSCLLLVVGFLSFTYGCGSIGFTDHYWQESTFPFHYIRTNGPSPPTLVDYNPTFDHQFFHQTEFRDCSGFYMITKVYPPTRYLRYSSGEVGTSTSFSGALGASNAYFFRYNNPFMSLVYTSLGSERFRRTRYIKRNGATSSLHYVANPYYWVTLPYVTRALTGSNRVTQILSSLVINNNNLIVAAYMNRNNKLAGRTFTAQPPNTGRYRFEALTYRYYKRITNNGTLLISQAVVLKKSGTERYIAVTRDANGVITLPLWLRASNNRRVRYNRIDLVDYRGRNATFIHPSDVSTQNVIDERFFEVLPQQGNNTYRLVSTLHPDRYLAVIRKGRRAIIAIAELSSLPTTSINYDFTLDLPGPQTAVRKLPDFPECTLSPRDMYTVNGQFCSSIVRTPN